MRTTVILLILLFFALLQSGAQTALDIKQVAGSDNVFSFNVLNLKTPAQRAGAKGVAIWDRFWEFGDGHFSDEEIPKHAYKRNGTYTVWLHLTPRYSTDKPLRYSKVITVTADAKAWKSPTYPEELGTKAVSLVTNQVPVPGHEMQVALTYRLPARDTGAWLVLGYVITPADAPGAGLQFAGPARPLGASVQIPDIFASSLPEAQKQAVRTQLASFPNKLAFQLRGADPGEIGNIILSLKPSERIRSDLNMTVQMKVLLLLPSGTFDPAKYADDFTRKIEASHDPNAIYPMEFWRGYNPDTARPLSYRVMFENTGRGEAEDIKVVVKVDDGVYSNTLRVLKTDPECPMCSQVPEGQSCLDTLIYKDSIVFMLRNILLHGRASAGMFGSKYRKGEIVYALTPKTEKRDVIRASAAITFDQNKPEETNIARTWLRLRGFGFRTGLPLIYGISPSTYRNPAPTKNPLRNTFYAVTLTDAPVIKGFAFEVEAAYSFCSDTLLERPRAVFGYPDTKTPPVWLLYLPSTAQQGFDVTTDVLAPPDIWLKNVQYLDLSGSLRYHLNENMGIGVGLGPSLLMRGTLLARTEYQSGLFTDIDEPLHVGLLGAPQKAMKFTYENDNQLERLEYIQESTNNFLGLNYFVDLRVGKVNKGPSGGLRFFTRNQFGSIYSMSALTITQLQLYFHWKI